MQLGETVTELAGDVNGKVNKVITTMGEYDTDLVLMSIGFKPNTGILADTGIELTPRGPIH